MKRTRSNSLDLRDNVRAVLLGLAIGPLAVALAWACYVLAFSL